MVRIVLRVVTSVLVLGLLTLTLVAASGFLIPLGLRELIALFALWVLTGVLANRLAALSRADRPGPARPTIAPANAESVPV